MLISGIYAYTNLSVVLVENNVSTGAVNIKLEEYAINDSGTEYEYSKDSESVLPGQVISLIPRISNLGDAAYIRAKISYFSSENRTKDLSEENINEISNDWIKQGDYWYYKPIVKTGENVNIFNTVTIPGDISDEYQGQIFELNIIAEAVQAENFNPDYNSVSPWDGISAEEALDKSYQADKIQLNTNVKVQYENNASLYIDVPDDFLGKLSHIIPGASVSQDIVINNTTSKETEYIVSTSENPGTSERGIELLKKLKLSIASGDEIIYDGSLYDLNNCSLGKYQPKESATLKFVVSMPSELGNEYSAIKSDMNWIFSVGAEEDKPVPEEPTPVEPKPEEPTPVEPEPEKPEKPAQPSPQTGDTKFIIATIAFFASAVGLIIVLFLEHRIKKNERN